MKAYMKALNPILDWSIVIRQPLCVRAELGSSALGRRSGQVQLVMMMTMMKMIMSSVHDDDGDADGQEEEEEAEEEGDDDAHGG